MARKSISTLSARDDRMSRRLPAGRGGDRGEGPASALAAPVQGGAAVTDEMAAETAAYIVELALSLRDLAGGVGLDFLAYLLDMAAEEANGRALAGGARVRPIRSRRGVA